MERSKKIVLSITGVLVAATGLLLLFYFVVLPRLGQDEQKHTGLVSIAGEQYYYNEEGVQQYGLQEIDGKLYYFDPVSGKAMHGWFTGDDGSVYYFGSDGWALTGKQTIDGREYNFGSNGIMVPEVESAGFTWKTENGKFYCVDSDGNLLKGLQNINGALYYFDESGARQSGWQTVGGKQYYFSDSNGQAAVGWMTADGATYYFGADGFALTGEATIDGVKYSFGADGKQIKPAATGGGKPAAAASSSSAAVQPGGQTPATPEVPVVNAAKWVEENGKKYYVDGNGTKLKGPTRIGGSVYCLDASSGEMQTGWVLYGDTRYYADPATGIAKTDAWMADDEGKNYYLGVDGYALTGLQTVNSALYLLDATTGARQTGLQVAGGKLYCFAGENDCAITGWYPQEPVVQARAFFASKAKAASDDRYFFGKDYAALKNTVAEITGKWYGFDENCAQLTGWVDDIGGRRYCFEAENNSAHTNTWMQHAEGMVYLGADGASASGLLELDGAKYFLNAKGVRQRMWASVDGVKYCFEGDDDRALVNQWRDQPEVGSCYLGADGAAYMNAAKPVDGVLYGFGPAGTVVTGWQTLGGKLYLLDAEGKAQFGWQPDGEKRYYLHGTDGYALTGLQTIDQAVYYFDPTTAVQETGWEEIAGKRYLFAGEGGRALIGEHTEGAAVYYFGSDGAAGTGVVKVGQAYYFHDKNGVRVTGWQTDGTYRYYFNEVTGQATVGWFTDIAGGGIYHFTKEGRALTGTQKIDGRNYTFDAKGKLTPDAASSEGNWVTSGGKTYFVGEDGNYVKNLKTIEGALYFFGADGVMRTGFTTYQNKLYYFDPATGKAVSGSFTDPADETKHYYFGTGGSAHVGLLIDSKGELYYYDSKGVQQFGEKTVDGHIYYFDAAQNGKAHLGWYPAKTGAEVRYYGDAGHAVTGMQKIGEERFLFDDDGWRIGGWYKAASGQLYCFNGTNNAAVVGDYGADGKTYHFTGEGVALVGLQWLGEGGPLYYFDKDGVRQTGWQRLDGLRYYFGTDGKAVFGLFTDPEGSGTYYFGAMGHALTGVHEMKDGNTYEFDMDGRLLHKEATVGFEWKTIDGVLYYTDSAGNYYKDLTTLDGVQYHFSNKGQATIGWLPLDGKLYHFAADGKGTTGWYEEGDKAWYFGEGGAAVTGKVTVDGIEYTFNSGGELTEGSVPKYNQWEEVDGKHRYYGSNGKLVTGLQTIDGALYFFGADNARSFGWQTVEGARYYFGPEGGDGKAYTGWQQVEGRWHIFDTATARQLLEWQYRKDGGKTYTYYYDKATGLLPSGWETVAGAKRYFYPVGGHMATGWSDIEGEAHYFFSSGERASGVVPVDGVLCSFNSDGKRIEGWNTDAEGHRYYFKGETALTGWNLVDNRWVLFDKDSARQLLDWQYRTDENGDVWTYFYDAAGASPASWGTVSGVYRYFYPDGHMAVGWNTIDGAVYYFARNGRMYSGAQAVEGVQYLFGDDGKLAQGWQPGDGGRVYYTEQGAARGWLKLEDGIWYHFDEETGIQLLGLQTRTEGDQSTVYYYKPDGSTCKGWETVEGIRRFFFDDGEMAVGWKTAEGKQYYFMDNGRVATGVMKIGDKLYSFGADGQLLTGWNTDGEGNRYYFTENGAAKGWAPVEGVWYRFDDTTGAQLTGWQAGRPDATPGLLVPTRSHYYYANGTPAEAGWHTDLKDPSGNPLARCYFDAPGQAAREWTAMDDGRYFFTSYGVPFTGWQSIAGRWYNFNDTGVQQTGWQERTRADGTKAAYYYLEDGTLPAAGWNSAIENKRRYVGEDGELPTGLLVVDGYQYYFLAGGIPATGKQTINNKAYVFDDQGRYVAPPVITGVSHSGTTVTVTGQPSTLLADKTLMYSFDNGGNWQSSAAKVYAAGSTIAAEYIQIKDSLGNITKYGSAYTVPVAWSNKHGIDVSSYQGYINWAQVAASGQVDFAIIRSLHWPKGATWYKIDPYFVYNCTEAKKYGIKVGTYLYSYAYSENEMSQEINFFFDAPEVKNLLATGFRFDLPIYIDYESPLIPDNTSSDARRTDIVRYGMVLIEQISRARYGSAFMPGFYTYLTFPLNKAQLQQEGYSFWLARYAGAHGWGGPSLPMWQYSSTASIPGISGNVDVNHMYHNLSSTAWGSTSGSGGSSGSVSPGTPGTGNHLLTVTNQYGTRVTDTANSILAQIVANEVGGFTYPELYKAQAVAAQAWILFQNRSGNPAPTVGLKTPSAAIQSAVNEVSGYNITYNGAQAFTPYHAYNNGTTNTSALWGSSYPYLTSVPSPADAAMQANVGTITLEQFKQRIREVYGTDSSGKYPYDYYPDPATWIQFIDVNSAGYVTKEGLTVCGRKPTYDYFYRTLVRYQNSSGGWVYPIASPSFSYTYKDGVFTFTSKGWGHGVGMSQRGANGLAGQNYTWQQILAHYYPGTTISTITS